ncbi:MAG: MerR family transcriptional regulator [Thiotrichales bacterium]|nr:MerR family transcriptional regulator [Thiotrichales bacterium]
MAATNTHRLDPKSIPVKKYLTIGEVSRCTGIKDHVLRYWEQHFDQLTPSKRSGRRYYQRADVLLIIEINRLLNEEGLTIAGAQNRLQKNSKSPASHLEVPVSPLESRSANLTLSELQQAQQLSQQVLEQLEQFAQHLQQTYP